MYFLKNSRCVLRKSQWFSSNVIERNFRITNLKSRAKCPEEDLTKPPLRLNIPKDNSVSGPCNLTPQVQEVQINNADKNINKENLSKNWVTPDNRLGSTRKTITEDIIPEKPSKTLDEEWTATILYNQNSSVRSKSSESLLTDTLLNRPSGTVNNFKLKKTRSYEELSGIDTFKTGDVEKKQSILMIDVELNNPEDQTSVKKMSPVEIRQSVTSDEEIKALAEAIMNEITVNKENVEPIASDKQDDVLVIINVTDKNNPDEAVTKLVPESSRQKKEIENPLFANFNDVCYGVQTQVRNLELSDEVGKIEYLKQLERIRKMSESDTPMVDKHVSSRPELVLENDKMSNEKVMEQPQWEPPKSETMNMTANNQKRNEVTFRQIEANTNCFHFDEMIQSMDLSNEKLSPVTMENSTDNDTKIKNLQTSCKNNPKDLSGLAKEVANIPKTSLMESTLMDDLPELATQSDNKILRKPCGEIKNMEDDKFKKSNAVRNYHNSCKNESKITENNDGEQSPMVIVNLNNKSKMESKDEEDNLNDDTDKNDQYSLKKEYFKNELDNSYDALDENSLLADIKESDTYPEEESVITNNKSELMEEKSVSKTNQKVDFLEKESNINNERYEPDMTDNNMLSNPIEVSESALSSSKKNMSAYEKMKFDILKDLSSEKFEMNNKCLNEYPEKSSDNEKIVESSGSSYIKTLTPKISDNIGNLANEEFNKGKGVAVVDTLSMMKQVREMVDLDLKNAEKIFTIEEVLSVNNAGANTSKITTLPLLRSVVVYNNETNLFHISAKELEEAARIAKEEAVLGLNKPKILDLNREDKFAVFWDEHQNNTKPNDILKHGDSLIVYNEKTQRWNVDFDLLKGKEPVKEEQPHEVKDKDEISPLKIKNEKTEKKEETKDCTSEVSSVNVQVEKTAQDTESPMKKPELKVKSKRESGKELDAMEIRKKNSDLYDDVFIGLKKPKTEERVLGDCSDLPKVACGVEKPPSEHYVSNNILEMSKYNAVRPRSNKIETVKLNIAPKIRPPSKVTEINLNKKTDEGKGITKKESNKDGIRSNDQRNGTFYKKFEKYKTPFSDPEYEEKPMKINSDLASNPNLKKLDSWNKTHVLQEISKTSDSVEGWINDESDKMATLLLKVLQDAAEGNSRKRVSGKTFMKRNPYEVIRKKQEGNLGSMKEQKKESGRKKVLALHLGKFANNQLAKREDGKSSDERSRKGQFPMIEDDSQVEILTPDYHILKESSLVPQLPADILSKTSTNDIPGPRLLKTLSSMWKYFPDLGCQTTIFLLKRLFQLAKSILSLFSYEVRISRNEPFGRFFMKYGPVVKLEGPFSGEIVLINRPEDINTVFNQGKSSSVLDSVEKCRILAHQRNFPKETIHSCGMEWDIVRKAFVDAGSKGCIRYFNTIKNTDIMFLDKIQNIKNNQNQVPDDFINEVKKWSMEGFCSVLFDKSLGFLENKNPRIQWIAESERLMRHLGEATNYLIQCESSFQTWRFFKTPALNGLNQSYQALDLIISKYIHQADLTLRKKKKALLHNNKAIGNKNLNFLESMLLNDKMTPDEIIANLIDMLLIGVNTTTTALAFLLYNLAQNQRVQCLLFKEVKDLLPSKNSELNYHQLHSLKFLQACLKESMRLHVPVPFLLRVLPNDIALSNYRVTMGTHLVIDTQTACMREQTFDDPDKFKPERWLDQDCIHPFSSIPFSNGSRAAFVKRLAEIQLWTCTAQIVRNYQIEYHFGDIRGSNDVISFPDKPLKLTFIERED